MDLNISIRRKEKYAIVEITGEIDLYNVKQLKEQVAQEMEDNDQHHLIMDLGKVKYIDSTGLGIIIGIKRRCVESNGELALVFDSQRITTLFTITGLHNVFTIYKTMEEAEAKFR